MNALRPEDLTPEEIASHEAVYAPFTERVRKLVDAALRTEVDLDVIREVDADLEKIVARLQERQIDGSFGLRYDDTGVTRAWGNAVIGVRNALAPPLDPKRDENGLVWDEFTLGAAYEGPPGLVHGGVIALLLDHVLGMASGRGRKPRMTAWLKTDYRKPTPLGDLRIEAEVAEVDGIKTRSVARLYSHGELTASAEGLFVVPRALR